MIIFSLILLSATSMIQRNAYLQVEGELEQEVVAVAQDIIEEGRTKEFDENSTGEAPPANIPADFTSPSALGPESSDDSDSDDNSTVQRQEFNDFDDYNGWKDDIKTEHGVFNIEAQVFYVDPDTYDSTNVQTTFKKMRVYISNKMLDRHSASGSQTLYSLEFIRNYYAD